MKKLILITGLFIFSTTLLHAQADSKAIQLGVKGGVNSTKITGDDIDDVKSRTSFNVGYMF
ncbi:MAG: hypothetical protein ACK5M1_14325 [Xanthomarina gelatinilytica]|uniref:hypothetical protein n=1 Tax=Xanthomarina gelatinilytica TaxID=1137281 RepID=UPI003A837613